jgi:hypothetical protein
VLAEDSAVDGLRLSIDVSVPQVPEAKITAPKKAQVANTYLQVHGIEELLQEAITSLLREQPEDPRKFLREKFADPEPREPAVLKKMPSVASWHMPLPLRQVTDHEVYVKPNDEDVPKTPFKHLPSVGSWCAKKPKVAWKKTFTNLVEKPVKSEKENFVEARKIEQTVLLDSLRTKARTEFVAAVKEIKTSPRTNDLGDMMLQYTKKKARDAILQGVKSGMLGKALPQREAAQDDGTADATQESPEKVNDEEVRQKAADALLQGMQTGDLDEAVGHVAPAEDAVRKKAAEVLTSNLDSGQLAETVRVSKLRGTADAQPETKESAADSKPEAKTPAGATDGGEVKPDEAGTKESAADAKPATKPNPKNKAKQQLISGMRDGNLDSAVKEVKVKKALGNL